MAHADQAFEEMPYDAATAPELLPVRALGNTAMLLGMLALCTLPMAAEPIITDYLGRGGMLPDHSAINTWGLISTSLGTFLALMASIGGICCQVLSPWGRPIMLVFGVCSVLLGLAGIYFHIEIIRAANDMTQGVPEFTYRVSALAEWLSWALGTLLGAWAVYVMTRPNIIRMLRREETHAEVHAP